MLGASIAWLVAPSEKNSNAFQTCIKENGIDHADVLKTLIFAECFIQLVIYESL